MKTTYSLVVRGTKGDILYAYSYDIIHEAASQNQADAEAMVQMGKRLVKEGIYKKQIKVGENPDR